VDLATGGLEAAPCHRVAVGNDDDTRPDGEDVAAERPVFLLRDLDPPDPKLAEQLPQPDREKRQEDNREIVGDGRDDRQEVDQLRGAAPVRDVEDPHLATDDLRKLTGPRVVRPQRPADAQQVRPEPEGVAALEAAWRLDPAGRRDAGCRRPGLEDPRFVGAVRFARAQRDGAAIADEQRVERVDEIGILGLGVENLDPRSKLVERRDEPLVLPARPLQVDRSKEAMGRIVERSPECLTGPRDEDLAKVGGHALGAETPFGQGHLPKNTRACPAGCPCRAA